MGQLQTLDGQPLTWNRLHEVLEDYYRSRSPSRRDDVRYYPVRDEEREGMHR